jgi:hypothetical protein
MSKSKAASFLVIAVIIVVGVIFVTSFFPTKIYDSHAVIKMTRSGCYGDCPMYEVVIYGDGTVFWNGEHFVEFEGETTSKIEVRQVNELVKAFDQANFFFMKDYLSHDSTDAPTVLIAITINGKSKTVSHYYGDKSAPMELYELECRIDEIVNTNQWVGSDKVFCRELIDWISK